MLYLEFILHCKRVLKLFLGMFMLAMAKKNMAKPDD